MVMTEASNEVQGEDKTQQTLAALGVGLVVIVIGLPLWWKTTDIYRVQLPYSDIDELADTSLSYSWSLDVVVLDSSSNDDVLSWKKLIDEVVTELVSEGKNEELRLNCFSQVRLPTETESNVIKQSTTIEGADRALRNLNGNNYTLYVLPHLSELVNPPARAVIGRHRSAYMIGGPGSAERSKSLLRDVMSKVYIGYEDVLKTLRANKGAVYMPADKSSMRTLKSSPGYDVTFTLFNPQPDQLSVTWDISDAVDTYLGSLLSSLKDFVHLRVSSQFLHCIGLGVVPHRDEATGGTVLQFNQLPHIINPIEAYLGSHVSNNPSINFIVYIPTREQTPLKIQDDTGDSAETNAMFSPRWGGLIVYNVEDTPISDNKTLPREVKVVMQRVMSVFASQLRLVLGFSSTMFGDEVKVLRPENSIINDWELDGWLRERAVENFATSTSTLRSLSELLDKIPNLVINDDIGSQVRNAVRHLHESKKHLESDVRMAYLTSREALIASEKAFFDPSLLELLYFPEDQKFAIYIPLFLPIGIPILLSVFQGVKWMMKERSRSS